MKFQTSLTHIKNGKEIIRGRALEDIVNNNSFTEAIYLLLRGELPIGAQTKMFNAILTSVIDHGPGTASAMTARISASAMNPLHASVAAGLLGMGERHGVVISQAMDFFYENLEIKNLKIRIEEMKANKQYLMGYGHKVFTDEDPRTTTLFEIAKEADIFGKHCELAQICGKILNEISSRPLPLNADGAIAAILCDMGFDSRLGNGIFVIARVPGLVAHVIEEMMNDQGIRRVPEEEVEYVAIV